MGNKNKLEGVVGRIKHIENRAAPCRGGNIRAITNRLQGGVGGEIIGGAPVTRMSRMKLNRTLNYQPCTYPKLRFHALLPISPPTVGKAHTRILLSVFDSNYGSLEVDRMSAEPLNPLVECTNSPQTPRTPCGWGNLLGELHYASYYCGATGGSHLKKEAAERVVSEVSRMYLRIPLDA